MSQTFTKNKKTKYYVEACLKISVLKMAGRGGAERSTVEYCSPRKTTPPRPQRGPRLRSLLKIVKRSFFCEFFGFKACFTYSLEYFHFELD